MSSGRDRRRQCGSALIEYLGIAFAVALMSAALVATREREAPRRPPVDPVGEVRELVRPPPRPRARSGTPAVQRPRPPRKRPPGRRIDLPRWW